MFTLSKALEPRQLPALYGSAELAATQRYGTAIEWVMRRRPAVKGRGDFARPAQ